MCLANSLQNRSKGQNKNMVVYQIPCIKKNAKFKPNQTSRAHLRWMKEIESSVVRKEQTTHFSYCRTTSCYIFNPLVFARQHILFSGGHWCWTDNDTWTECNRPLSDSVQWPSETGRPENCSFDYYRLSVKGFWIRHGWGKISGNMLLASIFVAMFSHISSISSGNVISEGKPMVICLTKSQQEILTLLYRYLVGSCHYSWALFEFVDCWKQIGINWSFSFIDLFYC